MTDEVAIGRAFKATLVRDLTLAWRQKVDVINPLFFYVLVISLFPISIGPEPTMLARIAPGIICVAVLLATLLGVEKLFKQDFLDGTLEQQILSPVPFTLLVSAKILAHWLTTGVPMILVSPLLAAFLHLSSEVLFAVMLTLVVVTPLLSIIAAIGGALTVALQKGGILIALLVLPLNIPVMIFASSALDNASFGSNYMGQLAVLAALLVLSLMLGPFAVASSLKISVS